MKKYFYIIAVVALGITACSKKEAFEPIEETEDITFDTQVYHVCIPASMEEAADTRAVTFDGTTCTSTFSTTEKVYVYNKTKSTMLTGYLTPSNLSNENKNCDLTGDLTGTIENGDELWLLYNSDSSGRFSYSGQNGLATGVMDGAKGVVTVSASSPLTTSFAHFTNLQSVFRFKFEDESSNSIAVSYLILFTANNCICISYNARSNSVELGKLNITPSPATSDYLYLGLSFNNGQTYNDKMIFIAYSNTHLYRATKTEPKGGFRHGKYYYNTNPIQMTNAGALQTPTITWTTPSSPVALQSNYSYLFNTENAEISLTGTDVGYYFHFNKDATVHLNSLTATRFEEAIVRSAKNLTLDITGTNSFSCIDEDYCVRSYQTMKLQGNGTLTVRSSKASYCGIYGNNNYTASSNSNSTTTELDVSAQLAADGYTVTRSARTDNGDGTYTWTYTVAGPPIGAINGKFTVGSDKQVYFSQGNLQYQASTSTWRFAEHQWDFVGDANALIASDYSGWIDLFGWGTSGYNHGANYYQPYSTSTDYQDYYAYGSYTYNLYQQTGRADWGYNAISNGGNVENFWRTLTNNEWGYVFKTRSTSSGERYAKATVDGVAGVILLPDDWSTSYHSLTSTNTANANYTTNNISSSDWTNDFEAHGAVFLPAAGRRYGTTLYDVGGRGDYWSSSYLSNNNSYYVYFISSSLNPQDNNERPNGYSVRLVKDAN